MADGISRDTHTLPLSEAARRLKVDEPALRALVQAGYLSAAADPDRLYLADVKAFMARNADAGSGAAMGIAAQSNELDAMLEALDRQIDELSRRAFDSFVRVTPEAKQWPPQQRDNFIQQAKGRFGAILAVTGHGSEVDDALRRDLEEVGANAAWADSSLPHLLLVLRISRDLLLRTAMKLAEEREGRWNAILMAFAARMLPSIDRLTDAIGNGYWWAWVEQQAEQLGRLGALLERMPYGIYEVDMDGLIQYANDAFGALVGRRAVELDQQPLSDILEPASGSGSLQSLLAEPEGDTGQVSFSIVDPDGSPVSLDIDTVVLRVEGEVTGFAGIVRQTTSSSLPDLSGLARHVYELRRSLEILAEAGAFLQRHADEMDGAQLDQAGDSVKRQADRLMVIVDELDEERKAIQAP